MRVAVTADLHLRESTPERMQNLEVLIRQLLSAGIRQLIIAGDLLDSTDGSYARVDALGKAVPEIRFTIIPGNHDPDLRPELFSADNIEIIRKPTLKRIDKRLFLFLPYREGSTMGEAIADLPGSEQLRSQPWILISHGDFAAPRPEDSGRESGYFPLTREDLARFKPVKVILGHIHAPNKTNAEVVYPGSPYPVTADEYGQRRVLLLDTKSASVGELALTHPPVRIRAEVFVIPDGGEQQQIREQLQSALAEQDSPDNLVVQVVLKGYSASRPQAKSFAESFLSEQKIACAGIDLESLKVDDRENLAALADAVRRRIAALQLQYEEAEQLRQTVLEKALEIVYGD